MLKPSADYQAALEDSKRIAAAGKSCTGKFLRPHGPFIAEIVKRLGCKTVLDYGCGRGEQYSWVHPISGKTLLDLWDNPELTLYDPAFPEFAKEPEGKFDLVICTHAMGFIPKDDLPWVIDRLYALAGKAIYISERLEPPRKIVGDNSKRASGEWTERDWLSAISRTQDGDPPGVPQYAMAEVTVALRKIDADGGKITRHYRQYQTGGRITHWRTVVWPEGVRAWNHKQA